MKNITLFFITAIYLLLMVIFWQTIVADKSYAASQAALKKGNLETAVQQANLSIAKNPDEPRYYYGRAKVLLTVTVNLSEEERSRVKQQALSDLKTSQKLNPKNITTLRNIIPFYYFLAVEDLTKPEGVDNVDPQFIETARSYFEEIENFSPTDAGLYVLLAKYEKKLGLEKLYNESIENIKRLRPDLLEWYVQ